MHHLQSLPAAGNFILPSSQQPGPLIGIGENIATIDAAWIIAWVAELDGQYLAKNRINGVSDPNSGGNIILLTPSVWVSLKKLILQFGAGAPVVQNLNDSQTKDHYLIAVNFGWKI